jgi:hypothetical protein
MSEIPRDETFIRAGWIMRQLRAGHAISRYHDCLHFIAELERDIYGAVVSTSVNEHMTECRYDPYPLGRGRA